MNLSQYNLVINPDLLCTVAVAVQIEPAPEDQPTLRDDVVTEDGADVEGTLLFWCL